MPSLYLERNGQLRCVAQRGLWQVLDGLPADAGITGQVWATGKAMVVHDVSSSADYLEAIPGVVAEICVPITVDGMSIGAINVDSLCPLPNGALSDLEGCAALLSQRLGVIGWRPDESPWQRAQRASVVISGLTSNRDAHEQILAALLEASGMDSARLVLVAGDGTPVQPCIGLLAAVLRRLRPDQLVALCGLVDRLSSCYTGGETTGLAYLGSEALRAGGARGVVLLPLRANNIRLGTIILAHTRPIRLAVDVVEPLELLAGQAAAALNAVGLVERLWRQAHHDGLTGLGNRAAFDRALDSSKGSRSAVLIADVDHFKRINDSHGHLAGDEVLQCLAVELSAGLPGVAFYRFGGDELTCLLPATEAKGAQQTAETVCAIGRRVLARWNTSISVGVAAPTPHESARQTLARADTALRWTKQNARGHARLASDHGSIASRGILTTTV